MMTDEVVCSKCGQVSTPEGVLPIDTDANTYYYCKGCLKAAAALLSMKMATNKDERYLLKKIRKFLKHSVN